LSVVCRSCGSEVSPYVTECPYCGNRIRKRAPKLERKGDELQAREPRRERRRRERAERAKERQGGGVAERLEGKPHAVIAAVAAPIVVMLVERATNLGIVDFGAIVGPVGDGEWWRYLAAPWVYPDVGYMLVAAIGIVIFGVAVERRLGTVPTLVLMIAAGALGMLAADGIETAIGSDGELLLAAGGNGIALGLLACWALLKAGELRSEPAEVDVIGAGVCAVVLILLPVVDDFANVFAGLGGGIVGAACGFVASFARRERSAE
jgi:membrane associated rhomboid family serine protease